ncbi:MAG: trypsin-like peptidase domain-containing protein [Gammaproteobacteria bacterium]|nr:trypsin-like peptidase domain-containing protein [Gammaproteobacteria bacterium]MBT8133952.1 trypsin-like peptidase domain-containing protein [Gammaproteobacteria bacterium]NNJ50822.1 trypsin-like serine protease [Gammaproteobacteria bacterium]
MQKPNHSFLYFFAWLVIGVFFGLLILLYRGDISLDLNLFDTSDIAIQDSANTTAFSHRGFSDAVIKAAPAVVSIQTIIWSEAVDETEIPAQEKITQLFLGKNSPHRPKKQAETGSGSGVIIQSNGYILTNYHVIRQRDEIHVRLNDDKLARAELIGSDPDTDLAILKIDLDNLPTLTIADVSQMKVGDIVLAIGDPFAIGQTVTQGIISATGRTRVSQNTYENFIQTDAAINPGNSGGALINTRGEIVGINSNIFSSTGNFQGISFAIPIDLAQQVAEEIIQYGYVVRGWLGVEGQELTSQALRAVELDSMHGILITDVDNGGPGDLAGLQRGDIITRINRQEITSTNDILNMIAAGRPGDEFLIEGIRQRQSFMTKAVLGQRPLMSR